MGAVCSAGVPKTNSGNFKTSKKNISDDGATSDSETNSTRRKMYNYSGELIVLEPARRTAGRKGPPTGSVLSRARIVGLERAVEVLDTLGSSITNMNPNSGFISGMASRGNKIAIMAFEVANTIVKGANLLQSLSKDNIRILKEVTIYSDGVQRLVSSDTEELLRIAATDKREEYDLFSKEVARFGDLCKDPQWHNLGRYFQKFDSDVAQHRQLREDVEMTVQELTTLAQHTAELYQEFNVLDRFEQDYRRKLEEVDSLHLSRKEESLMMFHSELKHQRKLVRSLKRKCLWSRNLEQVMEKLVDIVTFIHQEICEAFGYNGITVNRKEPTASPQRLGASGLALHYANIINQIDIIVSRPSSLPSNTRDTLYQGLPSGVKTALRSRLLSFRSNEELTVTRIKTEIEKTLHWLVPVATNTTKAHQGFGWVGEWANTGNDFSKKTSSPNNNLIRIQTLYHAEKEKAESYILELVIWLHHLIIQVRQRDFGLNSFVPVRSPTRKLLCLQLETTEDNKKTEKLHKLSQEERDMLLLPCMSSRRLNPRISKSQEFSTGKKSKGKKGLGLSKSIGSSPTREFMDDVGHTTKNVLDVIDGLGY